ncbi:MAG TPA: LuxR C-terminal-related transcriptional regulator [Polyangiaceae bacterium]|jgi:DNA-binding CsgD family transcriptional regulator
MGLAAFAHRAARATDVATLAASVIETSATLLGVRFSGLHVSGEGSTDLPERFVARYAEIGEPNDPVLAAVRERHAPMAATIRDLRRWARAAQRDDFMELLDYSVGHHYLVAPVVMDGHVVGSLMFARKEDRAFGQTELALAGALSLHVSTRVAALTTVQRGLDDAWSEVVSRRGLEVADLAARGLTTTEVGRALGVSPNTVKKHLRAIYEKLGISTRAELAMLLANRAAK